MANRVDIIVAAKNQASAALKQVTSDLNKLDDTAGRLASAGGLAGILGIAGGVGAVAMIGKAAVEASRLATEIARTEQAFTMLAGGSDEARSRLEAMRRATGGAVDDLTAMQLANRAAALGFADTTAELERTTKLASTISRVMGGDVATVLENIQAAASNLSFVRLDQMGISADGVRQKYDALREANSNLSKEAAFLEATLSVGEQTFGELGDSGVGAASGLEELTTSLTNLKNELLASGSVLDGFFGTMASGIQAFRDSEVTALAQHLTDISNQLSKGVSTSEQERLLDLYGKINDRLNELGYTVVNVNGEFQAVASEMGSAAGSAANLDAAESQLSATTQRLGNDFISVTGGLSHFNANLQTTAGNVLTLTSVMAGINGQINSIASGMVSNLGAEGALGYAEDLTDEARTMAYQWMQAGIPLEQIQGILLPGMLSDVRKANSEIYSTAKGVTAVNSEFNSLKSTISSIVSGATGPVAGVDAEDFLPREDEVNENARRLADIMVNGVKDQPWLDEFKNEVPGIWKEIESSGDPQGTAARILKDFQDGLRPELIDKGKAKDLARRALLGEKNTKALVDEIAGELAAEMGVSFAEAQAAASSAFGGGGSSGGSTTASITPKIDAAGLQSSFESAVSGIGAFTLPVKLDVDMESLDFETEAGTMTDSLIAAVEDYLATNQPSIEMPFGTFTLPPNQGSILVLGLQAQAKAYLDQNQDSAMSLPFGSFSIAEGEGTGILQSLVSQMRNGLSGENNPFSDFSTEFTTGLLNGIRSSFVNTQTSTGQNMIGALGDMFSTAFTSSIEENGIGAEVAGTIFSQIAASQDLIQQSGTGAGQRWRAGFMGEVMGLPGDILNTLAQLVAPMVGEQQRQEHWRQQANPGE